MYLGGAVMLAAEVLSRLGSVTQISNATQRAPPLVISVVEGKSTGAGAATQSAEAEEGAEASPSAAGRGEVAVYVSPVLLAGSRKR